jgi:hypothetical protein
MKLISFDVGIKNLSFCCLEYTNDKYHIYDWGIINISCDECCDHIIKGGKKCDKSAVVITESGKKLCNSHKKNKEYKDFKMKKVPKIKNPTLHIGDNIVKRLNEHQFLDVNDVIIENQPALKNPTMKTVQMLLYSYFLINGYCDNNSNIENIEMINARNKLKAYSGPKIESPYPKEKKNVYKTNKYLAIEYCKHMITCEDKSFQELFNNSKKKDDLSDSFLQGVYWILKKNKNL